MKLQSALLRFATPTITRFDWLDSDPLSRQEVTGHELDVYHLMLADKLVFAKEKSTFINPSYLQRRRSKFMEITLSDTPAGTDSHVRSQWCTKR